MRQTKQNPTSSETRRQTFSIIQLRQVLVGMGSCCLLLLLSKSIVAQSVANRSPGVFIDTSEWVQSSSPINNGYTTTGYITETIVRGYRGPSDSIRDYNQSFQNQAVEFSENPKIQPISYQNSPSKPANLAPNNPAPNNSTRLQPIPDPLTQVVPSNSGVIHANYETRGSNQVTGQSYFSEPASTNSGMSNSSILRSNTSAAINNSDRYLQTQYNTPASNNQPVTYGQPYATPASFSAPAYAAPTQYAPTQYAQTQYAPTQYASTQYTTPYPQTYGNQNPSLIYSQPVASGRQYPVYTSMLQNCCQPTTQTQFVTPNVQANPYHLNRYPQYQHAGSPGQYSGYRESWVPMIPLRSMPYGTYLGQGIIGQPVAYVDGEPVRNFLRYVFP